eukprot:scaffold38264_cov61-Phaeocystis_antarctica.AAC.5
MGDVSPSCDGRTTCLAHTLGLSDVGAPPWSVRRAAHAWSHASQAAEVASCGGTKAALPTCWPARSAARPAHTSAGLPGIRLRPAR